MISKLALSAYFFYDSHHGLACRREVFWELNGRWRPFTRRHDLLLGLSNISIDKNAGVPVSNRTPRGMVYIYI